MAKLPFSALGLSLSFPSLFRPKRPPVMSVLYLEFLVLGLSLLFSYVITALNSCDFFASFFYILYFTPNSTSTVRCRKCRSHLVISLPDLVDYQSFLQFPLAKPILIYFSCQAASYLGESENYKII